MSRLHVDLNITVLRVLRPITFHLSTSYSHSLIFASAITGEIRKIEK